MQINNIPKIQAFISGFGMLFIAALDFSINVSLPVFRESMNIDIVLVLWIIIVYHAARSGTGFIAGIYSDYFGIKRLAILGILLYTISVGLIGLQNNLFEVALLRIPQGIGAAILFTLGPALISKTFGSKLKGTALGFTLTAVAIGQITGVLLGGWISDEFGWQYIFYMRIPFGVLAFVLTLIGLRTLDRTHLLPQKPPSFESSILLFSGIFSAILCIGCLITNGLLSTTTISSLIISVSMFFLLLRRDQHKTNKLVTFSLSQKNLEIISGGVSNLLVTTGTFIMWFLFPFYVSDIVRESGLMIGFLLALLSFSSLLGYIAGGLLSDQIGDKFTTLVGSIVSAAGLLLLLTTLNNGNLSLIQLATIINGLGFGVHQGSVYALNLRNSEGQSSGLFSATLSVSQTLGTVLSIALFSSLFVWISNTTTDILLAYKLSFVGASIITMLGGIIVISRGFITTK